MESQEISSAALPPSAAVVPGAPLPEQHWLWSVPDLGTPRVLTKHVDWLTASWSVVVCHRSSCHCLSDAAVTESMVAIGVLGMWDSMLVTTEQSVPNR